MCWSCYKTLTRTCLISSQVLTAQAVYITVLVVTALQCRVSPVTAVHGEARATAQLLASILFLGVAQMPLASPPGPRAPQLPHHWVLQPVTGVCGLGSASWGHLSVTIASGVWCLLHDVPWAYCLICPEAQHYLTCPEGQDCQQHARFIAVLREAC